MHPIKGLQTSWDSMAISIDHGSYMRFSCFYKSIHSPPSSHCGWRGQRCQKWTSSGSSLPAWVLKLQIVPGGPNGALNCYRKDVSLLLQLKGKLQYNWKDMFFGNPQYMHIVSDSKTGYSSITRKVVINRFVDHSHCLYFDLESVLEGCTLYNGYQTIGSTLSVQKFVTGSGDHHTLLSWCVSVNEKSPM